jgi:hypothetical protein
MAQSLVKRLAKRAWQILRPRARRSPASARSLCSGNSAFDRPVTERAIPPVSRMRTHAALARAPGDRSPARSPYPITAPHTMPLLAHTSRRQAALLRRRAAPNGADPRLSQGRRTRSLTRRTKALVRRWSACGEEPCFRADACQRGGRLRDRSLTKSEPASKI